MSLKRLKAKSMAVNVIAAICVYLSLIYLWSSIRALDAVPPEFSLIGSVENLPPVAKVIEFAGILAQHHTLISGALVTIFYVGAMALTWTWRGFSGRGLLDNKTAIIILLLSVLIAIVLSDAAWFIHVREPRSDFFGSILFPR